MKLFNRLALTFCLCCTFWGIGFETLKIHAQAPYLEAIGSTEVELMTILDQVEGQPVVKKSNDRLEVDAKNLSAIYNLNHGKVIAITFYQYFPNEQTAIDAYNRSMNFLYRKGVSMREVRRQGNCRVIQGRGAGVNAHLAVLPVDGQYRLDAGLTCLN